MFRNFQTALPRNTTPATTQTVLIASTTMPCSLTCSVLAEDSRSSAIFRSSLPTKMHALLRVGDSSVEIKNAEAIQKLVPWKKLISTFSSREDFLVVSGVRAALCRAGVWPWPPSPQHHHICHWPSLTSALVRGFGSS